MKGTIRNSKDDSNLLKINLQLFAEDEEEPIEEIEQDDTEFDLDDEDEDDELSDFAEDEPEPEQLKEEPIKPEKKEKSIPLSAFKKEKARLQRIIDDLKTNKETPKDTGKISKQSLLDLGFDEATADALAGVYGKSASTEKLVNKKFRDMEFKELSKEFPDIGDYRDELEEYAESKGMSVEEAYMAKYGRSKLKANRADLEREIEQKIKDRMKKNASMKFDTADNGEVANKGKSALTADEKQAAKFLGMSEREYAIFSKAKSFETMDKHLSKKKG